MYILLSFNFFLQISLYFLSLRNIVKQPIQSFNKYSKSILKDIFVYSSNNQREDNVQGKYDNESMPSEESFNKPRRSLSTNNDSISMTQNSYFIHYPYTLGKIKKNDSFPPLRSDIGSKQKNNKGLDLTVDETSWLSKCNISEYSLFCDCKQTFKGSLNTTLGSKIRKSSFTPLNNAWPAIIADSSFCNANENFRATQNNEQTHFIDKNSIHLTKEENINTIYNVRRQDSKKNLHFQQQEQLNNQLKPLFNIKNNINMKQVVQDNSQNICTYCISKHHPSIPPYHLRTTDDEQHFKNHGSYKLQERLPEDKIVKSFENDQETENVNNLMKIQR